jgi:exosortase
MSINRVGALLALTASFALAYHDVFFWLADDWELDGNYSHGWLIVPIAAYLTWERREQLSALPLRPSKWGLVALVCGIIGLAAGTLAAETFVARISLVLSVVATIWYACGAAHVIALRFPLAFLLLMIPIPDIIFNRMAFPLQLIASDLGAQSLAAAGIPVYREGNVINLARLNLDVAEACSGIRSLISLFTLSLLYGYFAEPRMVIRVVLVLATIPVAILANGLRVAATGFAAHYYGAQAAEGFFHSFSGWIVFLVAGVALLALRQALTLILGSASPSSKLARTEEYV